MPLHKQFVVESSAKSNNNCVVEMVELVVNNSSSPNNAIVVEFINLLLYKISIIYTICDSISLNEHIDIFSFKS